jgi:hypothetical protein
VSYRNGMLTVVAENSMLSDVLNAIKSATGAKFDFTSGGAQERVAASIGPAPPRQVLMTLLNGSHYDYIILSSETNPAQVQSVVLTPKSNAPAGQPAVNAYNPPQQPQQAVPQISPDQAAGNDDNEGFAEPADQNQDQNQEDQDNSGQTPTNQAMPNQQPQYPQIGQPVNPQQPGTNPNGEGQVKSPEQLLQELRRMQQQNQQNNPNNPQTQRPDRPQ